MRSRGGEVGLSKAAAREWPQSNPVIEVEPPAIWPLLLAGLELLPDRSPIYTVITLATSKNVTDGGGLVNQTNDGLWLSFEALAKTYPHDDGVRMTADLARWLLQVRQRLRLPAPPILDKVVRTVTQELDTAATAPLRLTPSTSQ